MTPNFAIPANYGNMKIQSEYQSKKEEMEDFMINMSKTKNASFKRKPSRSTSVGSNQSN